MNESVDSNAEPEKPVSPPQNRVDIFPPFPEPTDADFEDDIEIDERKFYKLKYIEINDIKNERLHCTSCDRHMGLMVLKSNRMKVHPMLRTLVCNTCHTFYNSGEFEKGDDGSELYCRWCGQGGQVYCCSDCPHVFCAKCIKRNLGPSKIKEIENTDDWKCFKCTPRCLWDLRALCWALFRYCDTRNKIIDTTKDQKLKEQYMMAVDCDLSSCCRDKRRRQSSAANKKKDDHKEIAKKKEEKKEEKSPLPMIKLPSTIQVKKFASINLSEEPKKPMKRPASPKAKINYMAKPIAIAPYVQPARPMYAPPPLKRFRPANPIIRQVAPVDRRSFIGYTNRMMPNPQMTIPFPTMDTTTNGYNNYVTDNLNLSIENLTQGLDMGAVAAMANSGANNYMADNDLVCTPDLPLEHLEPLCEVNEDNTDDDVECISPAPVARNSISTNTKPLNRKRKMIDDNIIQMTENDVTVNAVTGGLKFRVDPQTLSSNKMYRLPDGRVFAITANPNMPGGYSATIVALSDGRPATSAAARGATFAARVSAVPAPAASASQPPPLTKRVYSRQQQQPKPAASNKTSDDTPKKVDLKVPVEWYRFNLVDAVDALEYSLMRLKRLKKDATTSFLRSRSVQETRSLHRTLDRLLNTSESRFSEIRKNLNRGYKQYLARKARSVDSDSEEKEEEDDDDVEILPNDDDPIFIDENSNDSVKEANDNQEVELVSSDLNDSGDKNNTTITGKDTSEKPESTNLFLLINDALEKSNNSNKENDANNLDAKDKTNEKAPQHNDESNDDHPRDDTNENTADNNDLNNSNEKSKNKAVETENDTTAKNIEMKSLNEENEDDEGSKPNSSNAEEDPHAVGDEMETTDDGNKSDGEKTDNDGEITDSKLANNDSKLSDVDMSADIIDSLLKDDVDEQDDKNDDDNKSIESGEFLT